MATIEQQAIGEVDVVAFERPIKKVDGVGNWPTGTIGAVVSDYGNMKEVEISNDSGEALDYVIVPVEHLKLIEKHSGAGSGHSFRPKPGDTGLRPESPFRPTKVRPE